VTTRQDPALQAAAMATIEIRDLVKRFGSAEAVGGLSFDIEQGSVTGFLGANGAGKTTTLRILLGLESATAGTARINGQPYHKLPQPLRQVGAALEPSGFHPGRTARNHLRILALAAGAEPSRADHLLDAVHLSGDANRRIGAFSLGMRQRLSLAAALIADPEVLILDEPANGLDPQGVRWLRDLLQRFAAAGGTVLVSSHILAEAAQTVDHVTIIDHGRLVRQGPLAELTASHDLESTFLDLTGGDLNGGGALPPQAPDSARGQEAGLHHLTMPADR
jgi:ABC-2 type transport system ATP-binding protein